MRAAGDKEFKELMEKVENNLRVLTALARIHRCPNEAKMADDEAKQLQSALSTMPPAYIEVQKPRDCSVCLARRSLSDMLLLTNPQSYCGGCERNEDITEHVKNRTAPDWCPQIVQDDAQEVDG